MSPAASPIRIQQSLQGEIAALRRQNVLLRGALATVVQWPAAADPALALHEVKAYALKALVNEPAPPPARLNPALRALHALHGTPDDEPGHGDVGSAGQRRNTAMSRE